MSTWTTSDRDRIIDLLDLTLDKQYVIENALTWYESSYGASAIATIQTKLTQMVVDRDKLLEVQKSDNIGITSQSVSGWYSIGREAGTVGIGLRNSLNSDRYWLVKQLRLQGYTKVGHGKLIRA